MAMEDCREKDLASNLFSFRTAAIANQPHPLFSRASKNMERIVTALDFLNPQPAS